MTEIHLFTRKIEGELVVSQAIDIDKHNLPSRVFAASGCRRQESETSQSKLDI